MKSFECPCAYSGVNLSAWVGRYIFRIEGQLFFLNAILVKVSIKLLSVLQ